MLILPQRTRPSTLDRFDSHYPEIPSRKHRCDFSLQLKVEEQVQWTSRELNGFGGSYRHVGPERSERFGI